MADTNTGKIGPLIATKAPNLPIAPVDYTQQYQDQVLNALRLYFNQIDTFTLSSSVPDVGATTQRPVTNLLLGQQFFDTTLGYPIWWNGKAWVNASGTTV
jgi:hypothetical protein